VSNELFPTDEAAAQRSKTMNRLILAGAGKGVEHGTMARTGGRTTPTDPALRERLSAALNDLEAAQRAKDVDAVAMHEYRVDRLVTEAREAREQPRDDAGRFAPSGFDGGVRGRGGIAPPASAARPETAAQLFRAMVEASRAEAAERGRERTLIARKF
jgi:hypothetical protein